jgi:hypothetical protein
MATPPDIDANLKKLNGLLSQIEFVPKGTPLKKAEGPIDVTVDIPPSFYHYENPDGQLFLPSRPSYNPKLHGKRAELTRKIDEAIKVIDVEKKVFKNA